MARQLNRRVALPLLLVLLAAGCRPAGGDREFLAGHGWTAGQLVGEHTVRLPGRFADEPGAFPVGLYWAFNNELSRDLGLDFSPLAGAKVTARIYLLEETLPGHELLPLRAVVLRRGRRLVGAYLDLGGHYGFAASLRGRSLAEVTGLPFGEWLEASGALDWDHPVYRQQAAMTPEEVVRAFFAAIDRERYDQAYALLGPAERTWYLFANRDPGALYNPGFNAGGQGLENMREATILRLNPGRKPPAPAPGVLNRQVADAAQVEATVEVDFVRELGRRSGPNHYFAGLVRETPRAPWLIDGLGSGP